jgi:hypothetical protein
MSRDLCCDLCGVLLEGTPFFVAWSADAMCEVCYWWRLTDWEEEQASRAEELWNDYGGES